MYEKQTPNKKYLLELIKIRSKVQEKIMSCERGFMFIQTEFIQTQKRYPTSLIKIRILT